MIFRAASERSSGETNGLVVNPYALNGQCENFSWPTEIRHQEREILKKENVRQ